MTAIFLSGIFFGSPAILLTFFAFLLAQKKFSKKIIIAPFQLLSLVIIFLAFGVYYTYRGQLYFVEPVLVAAWFTTVVLFAFFYKFGIDISSIAKNDVPEKVGVYSSSLTFILTIINFFTSVLYANNINPISFSLFELYNILVSDISFVFKGLGFWLSIFAACYIIILFFNKVDLRFEKATIASSCVLAYLIIAGAFG